jgi:uncharacterized Tic20 family protein
MNENDTVTPQPQPQPSPQATLPVTQSSEERTWAMIAHLSAFSAFVTVIGCVLGPLIVWLVKRDTMPFAADQAKEALNFNITLAIVFAGLVILTIITFGIGVVLTWPVGALLCVAWIVLTIIAAIKAHEGTAYRYPFTLRLVN